MRAWRITKRKYAEAAFEGFGARIAGGRWNSAGRSVVYLGGTPAIAALEVLVHDQSGEVLEESYVIIPVDIPDESVLELSKDALPKGWAAPHDYTLTQRLGDEWFDTQASLALRVPSAVVPLEYNVILNPSHPDMQRVEIKDAQAFVFDERLRPNSS
ncbi:MAG: RES family NAD+ phosphorylase [Deinococcota bacterium]|nr:RES family NAD+ phosphorylase [Deinococcota bacterium]